MAGISEQTDLLQCPYQKSHQILRARFPVHLIRCRKSYPNAPKAFCPFNNTHVVNEQELNWHVSICNDRQGFEVFKHNDSTIIGLSTTLHNQSFCSETTIRNQSIMLESTINEGTENDDNWDDDADVPAYNPSKYTENAAILRQPVGLKPAQRNAFREAEHKRLQTLANMKAKPN